MHIIKAQTEHFEDVKSITHKTISEIYPRYYPKGVVDFFLAHHSDENIMKDVAAEIGTNQNYLSTYINTFLEVSFQVWLNTLRIEESKNILITEKISIEEVGIKVGIPQSYNFSRWFRIVTSTTPYQYRKQHAATRS